MNHIRTPSWSSMHSVSGEDSEDLVLDASDERARRQVQETSPITLEAGRQFDNVQWLAVDNEDTSTVMPDGSMLSSRKSSYVGVSEKDESPGSAAAMSLWQEIAFIATIVLAQFFSLATLAHGIAPREEIAQGLRVTDLRDQAWFAAPYSLTAGTFVLMFGRLGDIYGNKLLLTSGYAFLGICSGFAGFGAYVQRQEFFEVCRALQGIGVAMMIPNALALLGRNFQRGLKKNLAFALFSAMASWGFVSGSLFSTLFAEYAWWPWSFWTFGILACVLAAVSVITVPGSKNHGNGGYDEISKKKKPSMDWVGSFLGVTGLVLFNFAWVLGPRYGWKTAQAYAPLAIGIVALAAFFWVETRVPSPILPLDAITWKVAFVLLLLCLGWSSFGTWLYNVWRFLEELRGLSPLAVTGHCTPVVVTGLLIAGATGVMLKHTPVAFTMMLSMFGFAVAEIIFATQPVHQTYWAQTFVSLLLIPMGMSMSFPAASIIISNSMPPEHQGLGASLIVTVVNYSIALGIGISGTVQSVVFASQKNAVYRGNVAVIRSGLYTAVALSGTAAVLGVFFFVFTMMMYLKKV